MLLQVKNITDLCTLQARAHALLKAKDAAITSAREGLEQEYAQQLQTQEAAAAEARAQAEQASHLVHLSCGERQETPFVAFLPVFCHMLLTVCQLGMRALPGLHSSVGPDCCCMAQAMQASWSWLQDHCRPTDIFITHVQHVILVFAGADRS